MRNFQRDQQAWFRVAEGSYDNFMSRQKTLIYLRLK
jgi:hypothetical protein